jgi:hypothetical protein
MLGGKKLIEVIKRHEGLKSEKHSTGAEGKVQVSINSDSRMVIRVIASNEQDTLIVLDPYATNSVISFVQRLEEKFTKQEPKKISDIPF